MSSFRIVG